MAAGLSDSSEQPSWAPIALAIATFAAVGFSLVLFVQTAALEDSKATGFLTANVLGKAPRTRLLITLLSGALLPAAAVLAMRLLRPAWGPRLVRVATFASPLVLIGWLPPLFDLALSRAAMLQYLTLLALFVLAGERLLRASLAAAPRLRLPELPTRWQAISARWGRVAPLGLVLLGALFYTVYVGHFTILTHQRMATSAFDLGIYDNLMYNALHGRFFESPVLFGPAGGNYLAGHAELAMLLFVPLYALRPGPETLLVLQAGLLGFAAVPLFLFARTQLPAATAAVVALAYLLFAPLHGGNFYDFHWLPLAIFFHFWLYYGIATRRTWLTVLMVGVLLAIREDISVGLALLGIFLLLTGLRPRLGLALTLVSVSWFVIIRFVVMPRAGSWFFHTFYDDLFADGSTSFASVVRTLVTNPGYVVSTLLRQPKLVYILHMLAPLAFLPCRRPIFLLLLLPGAFFTLLTTNYWPTLSISFQYTTHWIPYLFLGVVLALVLLSRGPDGALRRRAAVATMAVAVCAQSHTFGAFLDRSQFIGGFQKIEFSATDEEKQRYAQLQELVQMIPPEASVAATEAETPHVSTRRTIYTLRQPPGPVDFLLVRRPHVNEASRAALASAFEDPGYGLLAERGELLLLKRGHLPPVSQEVRSGLGIAPGTP